MSDYDPHMDDVVRDGWVWFWGMDGEPMSLRDWSTLFASPARFLASEETSFGTLTTCWLGTEDAGTPRPPGERPTEIFGSYLRGTGEERRYATLDEALAGHAAWLAELQATPVSST